MGDYDDDGCDSCYGVIGPLVLRVRTGFLDDERKPLERGHPAFHAFEAAWTQQDSWTKQEHREFWERALPDWPYRRGSRQVAEERAFWCRTLRSRGFDDDAIAEALALSGETFRREVKYGRREHGHRRTVPAPDAVYREHVDGPVDNCGAPPLPRVYADDESEPRPSFVNVRSLSEVALDRFKARSSGEPVPDFPRCSFVRSPAVAAIDGGVGRWLKQNGDFPPP